MLLFIERLLKPGLVYKNEIDVASLKSLKSVEKNSIDYDASSMKSIKSYISNSNWSNFQMPTAFQGYISVQFIIFLRVPQKIFFVLILSVFVCDPFKKYIILARYLMMI